MSKEERIILHRIGEDGNKILQFPYVKGDNIETPVPISAGGHGGKTAQEARTNLGITEGSLVDTGFIATYAGSTVPAGWLTCNGAAVSRTTYAKLFTAIGTTYGTGDGSTTFNLPNLGSSLVSAITTGNVPVFGNGMTIGYVGSNNATFGLTTASNHATPYSGLYGTNVGTGVSGSHVSGSYGLTTDSAKSGIVAKVTATKTTVKYCIKY